MSESNEQDFGEIQAIQLEDELNSSLERFDVEITKGRDYVQVRPNNVNKGAFVSQVLAILQNHYHADIEFVLCMGDDTTDESMQVLIVT